MFGATEEPYAQDWVVGPLPISEKTGYWPDTYRTQAEGAKIRVYDMDDTYDFLVDIAMNMSDIIGDLLNGKFSCYPKILQLIRETRSYYYQF